MRRLWRKPWQYIPIYIGNLTWNRKASIGNKEIKIAPSSALSWGRKRNKIKSKEIKPNPKKRGGQRTVA